MLPTLQSILNSDLFQVKFTLDRALDSNGLGLVTLEIELDEGVVCDWGYSCPSRAELRDINRIALVNQVLSETPEIGKPFHINTEPKFRQIIINLRD